MNPQQPLFELPVDPAQLANGAAARRREKPSLTTLRAAPAPQPAAASRPRELWVAVQSDEWQQSATSLPPDTLPPALVALVRRAQGFTPRVTVESGDALLLELAGSLRLFGGLKPLLQALRAAFPRPLHLALAPTPLAAVLLARAGSNCCILDPTRLQGRLAPLPLTHLRWPEKDLARLTSMGVRNLAELLRLPRAGLARRIGPERLWQLDRLTGARPDVRAALAQPEVFHARIDPDYETRDCDRLVSGLQPELERLEIFLRERQRGITSLRLRLHGRRSGPLDCILRCVAPEYRAARFAALLAARLERLTLQEPIRRMELTAGRVRRFIASSAPLWAAGEQGGAPAAAQAPEFLQTLLARLGDEAVYSLAEIDEHRPERQQQRIWPLPAAGASNAALAPGTEEVAGAARPLGLLESPQLLERLRDDTGQVCGLRHEGRELTLVSGPERIQTGWWDEADIARDYYVAQAADGARWWIYRECDPPRRWFVHGCFA